MLKRIFPRTHRFHCPDEHQLAAYVDQQLIGAERERVESHLAKCDLCLQQVGFLIKESQVAAGSAPSSLIRRAKKLATATRQDARFDWKWVSVAAASALLVLGLLVWREARNSIDHRPRTIATAQQPPVPVIHEDSKPAAETVRSASQPNSKLVVVAPQAGAVVRASDFTIRWQPLPGAAAYEVRVVTADGDLVWHKRVQENSANPPKQTLRPGLKYFVWVRALLANGKTQQSSAIGFIGG